jgi:hypothetical protein
MRVNVNNDFFLEILARFLNCKVGKFYVVYIGLPVGVNSMRASTWDPVVKEIEK